MYLVIYNVCWSFFYQIRKIPIKNGEEDEEGHPPGENEEANSDEHPESVGESLAIISHPSHGLSRKSSCMNFNDPLN